MANKDLKTRSTISNAVKTELLVQLKNSIMEEIYKKEKTKVEKLLDELNDLSK